MSSPELQKPPSELPRRSPELPEPSQPHPATSRTPQGALRTVPSPLFRDLPGGRRSERTCPRGGAGKKTQKSGGGTARQANGADHVSFATQPLCSALERCAREAANVSSPPILSAKNLSAPEERNVVICFPTPRYMCTALLTTVLRTPLLHLPSRAPDLRARRN